MSHQPGIPDPPHPLGTPHPHPFTHSPAYFHMGFCSVLFWDLAWEESDWCSCALWAGGSIKAPQCTVTATPNSNTMSSPSHHQHVDSRWIPAGRSVFTAVPSSFNTQLHTLIEFGKKLLPGELTMRTENHIFMPGRSILTLPFPPEPPAPPPAFAFQLQEGKNCCDKWDVSPVRVALGHIRCRAAWRCSPNVFLFTGPIIFIDFANDSEGAPLFMTPGKKK